MALYEITQTAIRSLDQIKFAIQDINETIGIGYGFYLHIVLCDM